MADESSQSNIITTTVDIPIDTSLEHIDPNKYSIKIFTTANSFRVEMEIKDEKEDDKFDEKGAKISHSYFKSKGISSVQRSFPYEIINPRAIIKNNKLEITYEKGEDLSKFLKNETELKLSKDSKKYFFFQ